ncbi:hypothetical protein ACI8AK_05220 [Geodermatophilus sp. SYSU D00867]
MKKLEIRHETALPMREISALALRAGPGGHSHLLAVSDEDWAVISVELEEGGEPGRTWRQDLYLTLRDTPVDVQSKSGFEGVAADGEGSILLLQEEKHRLLVLSADLLRLLQTIVLAAPTDDEPDLGVTWPGEPNAGGEGLVLLQQGHVVIAKQRDEPCLIEFGPQGHSPLGIGTDTVLAPGQRFERLDASECEFIPLAAWPLGKDTEHALPTINDLALGPDGCMYALSSHAHMLTRFERRLKRGERARAVDMWSIGNGIPGGEKARPEGLTILPDGRPLVGIDSKRAGNNLLVLQRLDSDEA